MTVPGPTLISKRGKNRMPSDMPDLPFDPDVEKLIIGGIFAGVEPNVAFAKAAEIVDEGCFFLEKT